ncbi:MAG: hypothetical protein AAB037_06845, partial [Chloroflexota bacterium]
CIVFGRNQKPAEDSAIRIAATLPGGGDLRTMPEESPLWQALARHHDDVCYTDERITVADRPRKEMAKWPWNLESASVLTQAMIGEHANQLLNFLAEPIGYACITKGDEIFYQPANLVRRLSPSGEFVLPLTTGETVRNWANNSGLSLFPYDEFQEWAVVPLQRLPYQSFLTSLETPLSNRITFGKAQSERGEWYEYAMVSPNRLQRQAIITMPEIATHGHALVLSKPFLASQTAPVSYLTVDSVALHHLVAGLLNSSSALFWLKQVCFNKGAGEDEERDRFVYAGGKVEKLPVPDAIAEALRGKSSKLAERLQAFSQACWERGRQLPALSAKKLFEKTEEAYHEWNSSLSGHVSPDPRLGQPFETPEDLKVAFSTACKTRESLRGEMVALQEEMDWLV